MRGSFVLLEVRFALKDVNNSPSLPLSLSLSHTHTHTHTLFSVSKGRAKDISDGADTAQDFADLISLVIHLVVACFLVIAVLGALSVIVHFMGVRGRAPHFILYAVNRGRNTGYCRHCRYCTCTP